MHQDAIHITCTSVILSWDNSDGRFDSQFNGKLDIFWHQDKTRLIFGLFSLLQPTIKWYSLHMPYIEAA